MAAQAFRRIASDADELGLDYHPSVKGDTAVAPPTAGPGKGPIAPRWWGRIGGPGASGHGPAAQYTSEGQKGRSRWRWKMAQAEEGLALHGRHRSC